MISYGRLILIGAIILAIFGSGFWVGNERYIKFKKEVEAVAKVQEAKVESITKQQDLVNKGIKNEYEAKLAAVKSFYVSQLRNPSSSPMSGISPAPNGINATAAYTILAGQCAQTTAQLTSLQDWVNAQVGIK